MPPPAAGAMDDELLQYLLDRKVPTFSMSSGLTTAVRPRRLFLLQRSLLTRLAAPAAGRSGCSGHPRASCVRCRPQDFGWGTPTFHKMGREKINLIHTFTGMGLNTVISDVDTVWLRDPILYMEKVGHELGGAGRLWCLCLRLCL